MDQPTTETERNEAYSCGPGGCGCNGGSAEPKSAVSSNCVQCDSKGHPVTRVITENILKPEASARYKGQNPHLCTSESCNVSYFDPYTNECFELEDCQVGIWFKQNSPDSYACYCEKITEEEIVRAVVETGLDDLGSVILYLRESFGENCHTQNPAGISCSTRLREVIQKGIHIREGFQKYSHLTIDSKEIPYDTIEARYRNYLMSSRAPEEMSAESHGCGRGGCGCH